MVHFGRRVEKVLSTSAGLASAAFTKEAALAGHFDSRVWLGAGLEEVVDYFSWRQADAARNGLNAWCYWTLRNQGVPPREADSRLRHKSRSELNELLFAEGVNFNDVPTWQRRGTSLSWHEEERTGYNPVQQTATVAKRRRLEPDHNLPMGEDYRAIVRAALLGG